MVPISKDTLPEGADWGYQLKWDGVRILAVVDNGSIEIYSRKLLNKNTVFPEVVHLLSPIRGRYLLDGEVVMFDETKGRPSFQKVLQRERSKKAVRTEQLQPSSVCYILFDLLQEGEEDMRSLPYLERHRRLNAIFPEKAPRLFVTDLFHDGKALWQWVETNQWEGVVSKRLSSPYKQGKKHQDWYKKKTSLELHVSIIGLVIRERQVASMVMLYDQQFLGRVSLGLNTELKRLLLQYGRLHDSGHNPFSKLPSELKGEQLLWLDRPFSCEVTGLEMTDGGLLRHPKIVKLKVEELLG